MSPYREIVSPPRSARDRAKLLAKVVLALTAEVVISAYSFAFGVSLAGLSVAQALVIGHFATFAFGLVIWALAEVAP